MATKTITVKNDVTVKVTTTMQTFDVTFSKTNHVYYTVTWTSGGLGTAPADITKQRRDAYTYTGVPYGAQYKVEYHGSSYSAESITGVITGPTTIPAPNEYNDYDNSCGCGNE